MKNGITTIEWLKDEIFKLQRDYDEGKVIIGEFYIMQRNLFSKALQMEKENNKKIYEEAYKIGFSEAITKFDNQPLV